MEVTKRGSWFSQNYGLIVFSGVLAGSLSLNVLLGLAIEQPRRPKTMGAKVGANVSHILLTQGASGNRELTLSNQKPTVLYIMSPTCVWCERNLANIQALAREKGAQYEFVALSASTEKLSEYLAKKPYPFPVVVPDSAHLPDGLEMNATPQMLVVAKGGRVEKMWAGALMGETQKEVEAYFGATLPGLVPGKAAEKVAE